VNQLQQDLSYTETPLTSAQAEQMAQLLAQTAPTGSDTPPSGNRNPGSVITDETLSRAQGVLSPAQLQALQEIQQQQQARAQLNRRMSLP